MSKKTCIFIIGSPASGKSTLAKSLPETFNIIETDKIAKEHFGVENYDSSVIYDCYSLAVKEFMNVIESGGDVCFPLCGATPDNFIPLYEYAKHFKYSLTLWKMDTSLKECCLRNEKRTRVVPENNLVLAYHRINKAFEQYKLLNWDSIKVVAG